MDIKASFINSANAVATTAVATAELNQKIENLAKKAAKNAKIDGFRKGKVPVSAIMQRYGEDLANDARGDIYRELISVATKQLKKSASDIIGEPVIKKFDEKDGKLDIEVEISFKPKFSLDGYEALIPAFSEPKIAAKELNERLDSLKKMVAPVEKSSKKKLSKGDFAKFDFEGFVDGKPFDGGKAEGYMLEIGSGQFIPGFEDGMEGLKIGEERDISVTFPADYGAAHLAGKEAIFKVKLYEIHEKKIGELDENALKSLLPTEQEPSIELLNSRIEEQLKQEKFAKLIIEELKPKFADALTAKYAFDLPNNIVSQEIDIQFRRALSQLPSEELKKFQTDPKAAEAERAKYADDAKNSVQLTFIVDELARLRKISVSDQELMQAIYFEAYRAGIDPKTHLQNYQNQGILPALKMAMIEEKLFNDIFKLSGGDKDSDAKPAKSKSTKSDDKPKAAKTTKAKDAEPKPKKPKADKKAE